ncbi:MAG: DUF3617 family protein, partial [Alphaproteobacteria bacterium]|nr:DUF3617 family protein [Alphaproteobacteria bacterium]
DRLSGNQGGCSQQGMNRSGNTIVVDSSCKFMGMTTHTHMVFEGDFDSAYTVKLSTSIDGDSAQNQQAMTRNMTLQAKWAGRCRAGPEAWGHRDAQRRKDEHSGPARRRSRQQVKRRLTLTSPLPVGGRS